MHSSDKDTLFCVPDIAYFLFFIKKTQNLQTYVFSYTFVEEISCKIASPHATRIAYKKNRDL